MGGLGLGTTDTTEDIYGTANASASKPNINFTQQDSGSLSSGIHGSIQKSSNKLGGEPLLLNQPSVDDFPQMEEVTAQGYGIGAGNKNYRNRESGTLGTIATGKKD